MKLKIKEYCPECELPIDKCVCKQEEECPFCSMVHDMLDMLDNVEDEQVRFDILHSVLTQAKNAGYIEALRNQADMLCDIVDNLEDEFDG